MTRALALLLSVLAIAAGVLLYRTGMKALLRSARQGSPERSREQEVRRVVRHHLLLRFAAAALVAAGLWGLYVWI